MTNNLDNSLWTITKYQNRNRFHVEFVLAIKDNNFYLIVFSAILQ